MQKKSVIHTNPQQRKRDEKGPKGPERCEKGDSETRRVFVRAEE
jgi:hypothetical protein